MSGVYTFQNKVPVIHPNTLIAAGAKIIGDVTLAEGASVWYNAVLRADVNPIRIGKFSNIQDNSTVHEDSGEGSGLPQGLPTVLGDYVTVGHGCILHACVVEDYCLIGMGAVILDGAVIGKGSIVGAGAVVTKGTVIPPFSVVLGMPAKVVKTLTEDTIAARIDHANHYYQLAMAHKELK
ncbi:MAG TPA: gamma carbonic anhydrase family protein [Bacillota bacterium]|nr:gamma carbonic anhydrase family protein [Bacillota bacterium]